jgi:hypothetical protein
MGELQPESGNVMTYGDVKKLANIRHALFSQHRAGSTKMDTQTDAESDL